MFLINQINHRRQAVSAFTSVAHGTYRPLMVCHFFVWTKK